MVGGKVEVVDAVAVSVGIGVEVSVGTTTAAGSARVGNVFWVVALITVLSPNNTTTITIDAPIIEIIKRQGIDDSLVSMN